MTSDGSPARSTKGSATAGAGTTRGFRDPWPSPAQAWSDPPWILEGRVATAWFTIERARVATFLSGDLMPAGDDSRIRARVRFYDLGFRDERGPNEFSGRFREAVVAFVSSVGAVNGEVSLFMWTDSDTYMLWGREIFGWPLERARMDFDGPLWSGGALGGSASGRSIAHCNGGELGLQIDATTAAPVATGGGAIWITPRRVLRRAGIEGDVREVLLVRPEVIEPGRRYSAQGGAWLSFAAGHPLAGVEVSDPTIDVVDGIRLRVGGNVDVVAEPRLEETDR